MHIGLPRSIKRFTNPIVGRVPIVIASGVNRGLRWSLAASGSGYGSGRRESKQMQVLWTLMHEGDVVWDVGAHYGFVTLAAARRVGTQGHVHAFEPGASNHWFLQRHLNWNRMTNVTTHKYAVGANDGTARFGGGSTSKQHRLGGGDEVVEVRTADGLVQSAKAKPPNFIKIDVEGAEGDVLRGIEETISPATRLLIAIHSQSAYDECVQWLNARKFEIVLSERLQRYLQNGFNGDADLFACGPGYAGTQHDAAELQRLGF
jgi:FkbM family methyltransferase